MDFIVRNRVFCAALSILISSVLILSKIPALELKADSTPAVGDLVIQGGGGGGGGALAGGGGGGGYVEYNVGTVTSFFGGGGNGFSVSFNGGGGSISGGGGSSEDKRPLANSGFGGNSGVIEGGTIPLGTPSSSADIGKGQGLPPAIPHATDRMGVVLSTPTSITQTGNLPFATVNTTKGDNSSNTNGGKGGSATVNATANVTLNNLTVIGGQNGSDTGVNLGGAGGTATFNATGFKLDAKSITLGHNYAVRNPVTGVGAVNFTVGTLVSRSRDSFTIHGSPTVTIANYEFDISDTINDDTLLTVNGGTLDMTGKSGANFSLTGTPSSLAVDDTITLVSGVSGTVSGVTKSSGGYTFAVAVATNSSALSDLVATVTEVPHSCNDCGCLTCPNVCGEASCSFGNCPWVAPHDCNVCGCLTCPNVCGEASCSFGNCPWDAPHDCNVCGCLICPNVCGEASCSFGNCPWDAPHDCNVCGCLICPNVCGEASCSFGNCLWDAPHDCNVCGCLICPNVCGEASCSFGNCPWDVPHDCNDCGCLTCPNVCGEESCSFGNCTWVTPHDCNVCGCTVCPNVCGGANCSYSSCKAPKPTTAPSNSTTPKSTPAPTAEPSPSPNIPDDLFKDNTHIKLTPETGTTITENALNIIKNSGVPVQIELPNGLVITIDPATITDQATMIDLNIEIYTTFQTTVVIDDVTVPALGIIINPAASGYFGFEVSFNIPASMVLEMGLDPNLVRLWYVSYEGIVIEKEGGVTVNADGTLTIKFDGASYYVLAEKPPIGKDVRAPKTGDNSTIIQGNGLLTWIWLMIATAFVLDTTLKFGRNRWHQFINKLK